MDYEDKHHPTLIDRKGRKINYKSKEVSKSEKNKKSKFDFNSKGKFPFVKNAPSYTKKT